MPRTLVGLLEARGETVIEMDLAGLRNEEAAVPSLLDQRLAREADGPASGRGRAMSGDALEVALRRSVEQGRTMPATSAAKLRCPVSRNEPFGACESSARYGADRDEAAEQGEMVQAVVDQAEAATKPIPAALTKRQTPGEQAPDGACAGIEQPSWPAP